MEENNSFIDWSEERSHKNYCGYCDDSNKKGGFSRNKCNSSCFTRTDRLMSSKKDIKIDHLKNELKEIPNLIKEIEQRKLLLELELNRLEHTKYEYVPTGQDVLTYGTLIYNEELNETDLIVFQNSSKAVSEKGKTFHPSAHVIGGGWKAVKEVKKQTFCIVVTCVPCDHPFVQLESPNGCSNCGMVEWLEAYKTEEECNIAYKKQNPERFDKNGKYIQW